MTLLILFSLMIPTMALSVMADTGQAPSMDVPSVKLDQDNSAPSPLLFKTASYDPLFEEPDFPQVLDVGDHNQHIIQFHGPVHASHRIWLEDFSSILGYIPENAFMADLDPSHLKRVRAESSVRSVTPLLAGHKLAGSLWNVEGPTKVRIETWDDMDRVEDLVLETGGDLISARDNTVVAKVGPWTLFELASLRSVLWIEQAPVYHISNDVARGIMNVNMTIDTHGYDGTDQIVAVSDTGLDTGVNNSSMHDDLDGRIVSIVDLWPGGGDGAADTNSGHGTHVAGSVLGNGSRSNGKIKGVAPGARLYFQALERDSDGAFATPSPLDTQVFQPAYDAGARVHSNSWGGSVSDGTYTSSSRDVDRMVWNNDDMVIVYAVGNDGVDSNGDGVVDLDSIDAPGTAKNCISVGASESYRPSHSWGYSSTDFPANPISNDKAADDVDGMAAFSSRGPVNDSRIKPDIVAPGTGILSLRSSKIPQGQNGWGKPSASEANSTYYMFNGGTSMSTPLVAGSTAVVRQFYEEGEAHPPSAALVKATLINGADDMPGQYSSPKNDTGPVWDYNQGWGRLNLTEALYPDLRELIYDDQNHPLNTGENYTYDIEVTGSSQFRVSLVWTDYFAAPNANPALVNDLDLTVTAPNSTVYKGNVFSNGGSVSGGSADNRNNVENVYLDSPSMGNYTVKVEASSAPQGPQSYALVLTGVFSSPPPTSPTLNSPENGVYTGPRPTFNISSDDVNGDDIAYRIELSKDNFTSIWRTYNQTTDTTGWTDTSYSSGEDALFTVPMGGDLEDGTRYFWRAYAWDGSGWSSSSAVRNFTVDGNPPTSISLSINSGSDHTNSRSVNLGISATDGASGLSGGVSGMAFSQDGSSWTDWEDYGTSRTLVLEDFQGLHRVYLRIRDAVGNVADPVSSTITYDNVAPTALVLTMEPGGAYTNDSTVDLSLSATDLTSGLWQMSFSNDGSMWSSWEDFSSTRNAWDLNDPSAGGNSSDGRKTLHYRVRDNATNVALPVSSSIVLDTTGPENVALLLNGGDQYTNERLLHLTITGMDALSGITSMALAVDDDDLGPWEPFSTSRLHILPREEGEYTIGLVLRDAAGNRAAEVQATIIYDRTAPVDMEVTLEENRTSDPELDLGLSANDTLSGLDSMSFSQDGEVWTPWEEWAGTKTLSLEGGDGLKWVYMRVRDNAGNIGGPVRVSIFLDTQAPDFTVGIMDTGLEEGYSNTTAVLLDIDLEGDDECDDLEISISNDGMTWSNYEPLSCPHPWELSPGDGEKSVVVNLRDRAGNDVDVRSGTIILDTISPAPVSMVIDDGAEYTRRTTVRLHIEGSDENGLVGMSFSTDGVVWTSSQPFSRTHFIDLGSGNGERTVHMRLSDPAGNTVVVSDGIILDTSPPEIYSIDIGDDTDGPVHFLSSVETTYTVSAMDEGTNLSEISFGYDGVTWGPWANYSETGSITLPEIEGNVNIYVRVKDRAGNVGNIMSKAVVLDMSPPEVISLEIDGGATTTTGSRVDIRIFATDPVSGLNMMRHRVDSGEWSDWVPFSTSDTVNLGTEEGDRSIGLEVSDKAGNVAPAISNSIEVVGEEGALPELDIDITSHSAGEEVRGSVRLSGTVEGGTPSAIEIMIDDEGWIALESGSRWSYTWDTGRYEEGMHTVQLRANNGEDDYYSGTLLLVVDNEQDTIQKATSDIEMQDLIIYIIVAAIVGALAGAGAGAARRPKNPGNPSSGSVKRKTSGEGTSRGRSKSAGFERATSIGASVCSDCGYDVEPDEASITCPDCGSIYHEYCAEVLNGYCSSCGGRLY